MKENSPEFNPKGSFHHKQAVDPPIKYVGCLHRNEWNDPYLYEPEKTTMWDVLISAITLAMFVGGACLLLFGFSLYI